MIKNFIDRLGSNKCIVDQVQLKNFKTDKSYEQGVVPTLVVFPESDEDVKLVLELANQYRIPVTSRGAGSGKSGGAVPEHNGIILSFEKMNKILECDKENACMVVQPGVITDTIKEEAEAVDLFYPPNPSSSNWCTIGGNVAENAGSSNALKYGVTGDYVLGLEGFFANGTPFKLGGKLYKDVAGYDLKRLIVGSEGTLVVVTKIILKLIPKPKFSQSLWCCFESLQDGCDFLQNIARSSYRPAAAEFVEKSCIDAVERVHKKKFEFNQGQAMVLLTCDAQDNLELSAIIETVSKTALSFNRAKVFSGQDDLYWFARRAVSEALETVFSHKISEDITVPPSKISEFLLAVKKAHNSDDITIIGYGHLGDGNIHTNILMKEKDDKKWKTLKPILVRQILKLCVDMGGTLTGEHGIGLTKKEYMNLYFSNHEIEIMKQIKAVFDPNHILNPSKLFR